MLFDSACRTDGYAHSLESKHNRLCDQIYTIYPDSEDEQVYQLARKIVGAQIQKITYEEWLPVLGTRKEFLLYLKEQFENYAKHHWRVKHDRQAKGFQTR